MDFVIWHFKETCDLFLKTKQTVIYDVDVELNRRTGRQPSET